MTNSINKTVIALSAFCFAFGSGCSNAEKTTPDSPQASLASTVVQVNPTSKIDVNPEQIQSKSPVSDSGRIGSRVLQKQDLIVRGSPGCKIDYAYEGIEPLSIFWGEPCSDVYADMVTQQTLETHMKWERLDSFARDFINAMPGGKVLYIGGEFTASIYPVNTTGLPYEIVVAD